MNGFNLKKSQYRPFLILIVAGLLLALFEGVGFFEPVKKATQVVTVPIQLSLYSIRQNLENGFKTITEIGLLRDKNVQLEAENAQLLAENEKLKILKQENKALREQLGAATFDTKNLIVAKVIGESPLISRRLVLIDKGKVDGVEEGMFVVLKDIFVGEVYDVSARSSSLKLISDPDTEIAAVTSRRVKGLVVGQFGAEAAITNVLQGKQLSEGDLVLTTGEDSYPVGLVLGRIKEVKKVENELFQAAVLESLVDVTSLTTVFILAEK